jgi:hypothetical protein
MLQDTLHFRTRILEEFGAKGSEIDELLAYNTNVFDHSSLKSGLSLPLKDEPFVPFWEEYAEDAEIIGVVEALKKRLIQFNFPIQEGISETEDYKYAVRKGILSENLKHGRGLVLKDPDKLVLLIHQTPAGKIPLIVAYEREDFVFLLQALTCKNEPKPIPASQGASMVAGYNNWDRIAKLKENLRQGKGVLYVETFWPQEFKKIIPQKHLYQDKFIMLSQDYYSGVTPQKIGLDEKDWREKSFIIRREHECTHYFTKRVLSSMQNKVLDELIADYAGITAAAGRFRADWFFAFVGLEDYPHYREGGRLQNYRGMPPLSDGAFTILQKLVYHAAKNLEEIDKTYTEDVLEKNHVVLALTYVTLEELASKEAVEIIQQCMKI